LVALLSQSGERLVKKSFKKLHHKQLPSLVQRHSDRISAGKRQGLFQPEIGAKDAFSLLERHGLRFGLSQLESRHRHSPPSGQVALPGQIQSPPGRAGQISPDQLVVQTHKCLRASGVALPAAAAK
jgi:hypothetical protein